MALTDISAVSSPSPLVRSQRPNVPSQVRTQDKVNLGMIKICLDEVLKSSRSSNIFFSAPSSRTMAQPPLQSRTRMMMHVEAMGMYMVGWKRRGRERWGGGIVEGFLLSDSDIKKPCPSRGKSISWRRLRSHRGLPTACG